MRDKTTARLDENSKVLVVEGPVASGKSKFAKQLAAELDMQYYPEANQEMVYINYYGYDIRKLDKQLPERCRTFDVPNFLTNPKHVNVARFQIEQFIVKLRQYVDALAYLLSTGQGVILDRSVYSDFVFVEAMYKQGYLSKAAYKKYYEFRDCTLGELLKPHLVIYLDVPVPKVLENIKKRNISYEANSQVLTPEYLATMEKTYKQSYLKQISKYSELLIYDWSEEGEVEIVVEDIERINFHGYDEQDTKMQDWRLYTEQDWNLLRKKYAHEPEEVLKYLNVPCYDVPELMVDGEDIKLYYDISSETPGNYYMRGFNRDLGEKTLFRWGRAPRDTLPLRERTVPK